MRSSHPDSHACSPEDTLIRVSDPNHAANLIPSLCAEFYKLGWVTGTGGGISIRQAGARPASSKSPSPPAEAAGGDDADDGEEPEDLIYIAPSGVQKERMRPEDLFVLRVNKPPKGEEDGRKKKEEERTDTKPEASSGVEIEYIRRPDGLKPSACTPLFLAAFERRGAAACIHTHSQWAVLVTLMVERDVKLSQGSGDSQLSTDVRGVARADAVDSSSKRWDSRPGPDAVLSRPFRISQLEQIKGIPCAQFSTDWKSPLPSSAQARARKLPHHSYYSTLTVPVIENTAHEEDLAASLTAAMEAYPNACAVLVMRHGVYVWGESWAAAKTRAESLDYIFRLAVEMRRDGFSWV